MEKKDFVVKDLSYLIGKKIIAGCWHDNYNGSQPTYYLETEEEEMWLQVKEECRDDVSFKEYEGDFTSLNQETVTEIKKGKKTEKIYSYEIVSNKGQEGLVWRLNDKLFVEDFLELKTRKKVQEIKLINKDTVKTIELILAGASYVKDAMTIRQLNVILKIQNTTGHRFLDFPSKEQARKFISKYIDESIEKSR